jgi:hypothetical protein
MLKTKYETLTDGKYDQDGGAVGNATIVLLAQKNNMTVNEFIAAYGKDPSSVNLNVSPQEIASRVDTQINAALDGLDWSALDNVPANSNHKLAGASTLDFYLGKVKSMYNNAVNNPTNPLELALGFIDGQYQAIKEHGIFAAIVPPALATLGKLGMAAEETLAASKALRYPGFDVAANPTMRRAFNSSIEELGMSVNWSRSGKNFVQGDTVFINAKTAKASTFLDEYSHAFNNTLGRRGVYLSEDLSQEHWFLHDTALRVKSTNFLPIEQNIRYHQLELQNMFAGTNGWMPSFANGISQNQINSFLNYGLK